MADYEVGYGKPPQHRQFKKGMSGNPGGRPKATANIVTALHRVLAETITINQQGKTQHISRLEAALDTLVAKSIAGDTSAFRLLTMIMQTFQEPPTPPTLAELQEADRKVMEGLSAWVENGRKKKENEASAAAAVGDKSPDEE